jgi:foldase protein PrsA
VAHWRKVAGGDAKALEFLLSSAWIAGEARERGILVTLADAREALDADVDDAFGSEGGLRRFLRESGQTRADVVWRYRIVALSEAIQEQVSQPAALSVTQEQIDAYVAENPRTEPERRDLRIVLTRTRNEAHAARRALRRGRLWKTVTKRYSLDRGGVQHVEPGALEPRADRAVFAAQRGELSAPVKTPSGYYVFKVIKIVPAHPAPPDVQRATAWEILASQAQERALATFMTDFTAKWRARTTCAVRYATLAHCGN